MNKRIIILFTLSILLSISAVGQLSNISFSVNNFLHQKSQFNFLNQVDKKGAFLEPTTTFGQHYLLELEQRINNKIDIHYGLGVGFSSIGYRYKRSEEFLSIGFENRFVENVALNTGAMFVAPVGFLFKLYANKRSDINFNINAKTIFSVRSGIRISSGVSNDNTSKSVYNSRISINNEYRPDFTIGAGIDYRRQILDSTYWWKVGLNMNYALTTYYTGNATLFGDDENLDIEIENKLHHVGVAVGIIKSLE